MHSLPKSTETISYPASFIVFGIVCVSDGFQYALYVRADLQSFAPINSSIFSNERVILSFEESIR